MKGHPGGAEHSRHLIGLANLPASSQWLDMGAGEGSTVGLLRSLGHEAMGIDLAPRGENVIQGDYLHTPYADGSFDGIISECAFYISGDVPGALREAGRLLHKGGMLVFSDVCEDAAKLLDYIRQAGFALRHMEDLTPQWKQYYIEALWRDEVECVPRGRKCSYVLLVCERM